jgi:hypothetical protein
MDNFEKFLTPNMLSLTDSYAVKILICYFLKEIDRPVTPEQLTEIALSDGILNYFYYTEAMNSMLEAKTIEIKNVDGVDYYYLTEMGRAGAESFKTIVPKSFRDKILAAGLKFFAKLKIEHDVKCEITKLDKGYSVSCVCNDNDVVLMDMKLFAPDEEQAKLIREKIMQNPTEFYGKVLNYALENEQYVPEIN